MINKNELVRFFELKSIKYDEVKVGVWQDFFKNYNDDSVLNALKQVVLDTSVINPNVGDVVNKIEEKNIINKVEKEWNECLQSAKFGGMKPISARAAKVLNSMGGMTWLREADPNNANWQRKEFIEIYNNTPEPQDLRFKCEGLNAEMYIENKEALLLE